jgi:hypothetical protein
MIHKQQTGHCTEDIIAGLCEALVRNYLNNLAKGKEIRPPVLFQGGVAANVGIAAAFEKILGTSILIPSDYDVMGAYGAAILAKEAVAETGRETLFHGFDGVGEDFTIAGMQCKDCPNQCEIIRILSGGEIKACWGDRCGKWSCVRNPAGKNT